MTTAHPWRRSYTFIVLATALIVAAADFFFYGHAIGWTVSAIVAAMFCLIAVRDTRFYHTVSGRAFTLALVGLLFALVDQPTIGVLLCHRLYKRGFYCFACGHDWRSRDVQCEVG